MVTRVAGKRSFLGDISESEKKVKLDKMNEERDFDNMLFDLKAQGPQRKKEKQVLHGPTMSGIGGDPRIRKSQDDVAAQERR
jgi:hypothetical protein